MPRILLLMLALAALNACISAGKSQTRKCEVYAIVPPQHANPEASNYIQAVWRKRVLKSLGKCDRIVDSRVAKDVLATLGMAFDRGFHARTDLTSDKAAKIAAQLKATRLVALRYKTEGRRLVVGPGIYDLKLLRLVKASELVNEDLADIITIALPRDNPLKDSWTSDLKAALVRLIPNTITFGFGRPLVSNDRDDTGDLEEASRERQTLIPSIVSAFGVTNIDHRNAFNTWDADFSLAANVHLLADDGRIVYRYRNDDRKPKDGEDLDYEFTFYAIAATINGRMSLYWPLGTSFVTVGVGLAPFQYRDDMGTSKGSVDFIRRFVVGHRMFYAQRWYVELSVDSVIFSSGLADTELMKSNNVTTGFLGLGWFFPRSRYLGL